MLPQKLQHTRPRLFGRAQVCTVATVLRPKKPVSRSFVTLMLEYFAESLNLNRCRLDGCTDARIISAVQSKHGRVQGGKFFGIGRRPIINDCGAQIGLNARVPETPATAPAKSEGGVFSICGGKFDRIGTDRIQSFVGLFSGKISNQQHDRIAARDRLRSASVRSEPGNKVGRNCYE